jgi:putative PIN family toxin of toxin-antitoxin system
LHICYLFRVTAIVLDTNVFVNALLSTHHGSRSRAVVRACITGQHEPLFGVALFREYEDALSRTALFARSRTSAAERTEVFGALLHRARWVEVYFAWRPNLMDEGDNHLIELAVAGGAEALVTRNIADFKRAELKFPGLAIVTPEQFLEVHPCQP